MTYKLNISNHIPAFEAHDQEGRLWTDKTILQKPAVIYFYPKDDTPGCTKEACSFRDNIPHLNSNNVHVFGVSPDSLKSHIKFIEKHNLNFTLLSDESRALCEKFDVLHEKQLYGKTYTGVERSTFIVDTKGIIKWVERDVSVDGHVERILEAIKDL